jgi:hypothetical protein
LSIIILALIPILFELEIESSAYVWAVLPYEFTSNLNLLFYI